MKPAITGIILMLLALTSCRADDIAGGYAMSWPGSISYLRLVQRGQNVTGYLQAVTMDPKGNGQAQTMKSIVVGSVSGRSVQLQIDRDVVDGTWGSGKITLETPVQGYVGRMRFSRISVEAWNRRVAAFVATEAKEGEVQRLRADYDLRATQFNQAKNDLALAKPQLVQALKDQALGQKALKDAQVEYDKKAKSFRDAEADASDKAEKARQTQSQEDQVAANQAQAAANTAQGDLNSAEAILISIRDNQIGGLPAADRIVAELKARIAKDQSDIQIAYSLATDDVKKHRALTPTPSKRHTKH